MVAVTGGAESETLLRRGARLAQRAAGSELLAVHVIATDGLRSADERRIARAQQLVASLGGTFHSVVGEDVSAAVVDFAAGANATMIVVGVSRHGRLRRLFTGTTGDRIASLAGVDRRPPRHPRRRSPGARCAGPLLSPLTRARQVAGWVGARGAAARCSPGCCTAFDDTDQLPLAMLPLLAATVARRAGRRAAAGAARARWSGSSRSTTSSPRRSARSPSPSRRNLLALLVFVAVAAAVATVVDRASRRAAEATARPHRGRHDGRAVAVGADRPGHRRGDRRAGCARRSARTPSPCSSAGRRGLDGAGRRRAPRARRPPTRATPGSRVDDDHVLALCGEPLRATDQRVLEAFAVQTGLVLEYRRLREREERAAALERAEATCTALLRAVSHDLRTPLATMRAAVDGLLAPGVCRRRPRRAGPRRSTTPPTSSSGSSTTCSTSPGSSPGCSTRCCGPAASTRCCRWRSPASRRARSSPRGRRAGAARPHRRRACSSGWSPTWSATPCGVSDGHAGAGAGAGAARDASRSWWSTAAPASRPTSGSGCSSRSSGSTTPAPGGLGLGLAVARGPRPRRSAARSTAEDTPGGGLTMVLSLPRAGSADVSGAS